MCKFYLLSILFSCFHDLDLIVYYYHCCCCYYCNGEFCYRRKKECCILYQSVILLNILIIGLCYITQVNITRLEMEFAYHACTDPLHHRIAVTTQALWRYIIEDSLEKRVLNVLAEQRAHNYREISTDKLQLSILDSFTVDDVIDRYRFIP